RHVVLRGVGGDDSFSSLAEPRQETDELLEVAVLRLLKDGNARKCPPPQVSEGDGFEELTRVEAVREYHARLQAVHDGISWLEIRGNLVIRVARNEPQVFVGRFHDRPRQD